MFCWSRLRREQVLLTLGLFACMCSWGMVSCFAHIYFVLLQRYTNHSFKKVRTSEKRSKQQRVILTVFPTVSSHQRVPAEGLGLSVYSFSGLCWSEKGRSPTLNVRRLFKMKFLISAQWSNNNHSLRPVGCDPKVGGDLAWYPSPTTNALY